MSEHDSKSEEEKIQAMLQQSSDQWDEQQDQLPSNSNASPKQHMRSPQPFPNPMMNAPPGFNPMMNLAMLNPQLQFQQMMMQQQMQQMHQPRAAMGQSNIPPETQKPPIGYVCFKCRQPGHWIYYCPNVPKGQFVPRPGMNGSQQAQQRDASAAKQRPSELTCRICGKLMKDAVLVPCCGKSFCKECITTKLDETNKCPVCNKEDIRSSQVIPNRSLRNTIQAYQEQNDKEAEAAAAEAADVQPTEEPAEDRQPQQQQQQRQPSKDEIMDTENDPRSMVQGNNKGGLPIQVFESEERTPRKQKHEGGMPETMGGPTFGGNGMMMGAPPNDMSWMMGMPPGMNPAAAAAMMQMRMGADNWGFGMGEGMAPDFGPEMDMAMSGPGGTGMPRPPFMNPAGFPGGFPGAPEEMWNGMGGPFPGMPPQDMMQFGGGPMGFNQRGGFGGGRGRGRGGKPFTAPGRRRSTDGDNKRDEDESSTEQKGVDMAGPDEAIPTAPRAERERYANQNRYRSSSSRHHRRSSRSPSRSRSPRREEYRSSRRTSRSRSKSPTKSKRRTSRSRSPSKSRSAAARQTSPEDRLPTSPRSHRERRTHRSSRHHSSRYRSRERERDRDRDREREKDRDRSRDRSKRRDRR